ncbi:MAG TPA: ABC transporter permease [Armatimonadota bacterium]|jgi:ribose/xylose/arabinose/galactoside ABC-type transport system permease subunit
MKKRLRLPAGAVNLGGLALAWLAVFGYFSYYAPSFHTMDNLETLARQGTVVSMSALGMTYVIVSGGIDLSVGSIMAFVTVVVAWILQRNMGPVAALAAGVGAGAFCGLVNGFLITRLKVAPFIVTLGTYLIVRGAAKGMAHEQKIDAPITWLNDLVARLGPDQRAMLFPAGVWLMLVLAVAVAWALRYTQFGRHVVAVGSSEAAARLCGVPVERVKLLVYTMSGLFAGLGGLLLFSRLSVGDPTVAIGQELDVIAAVVIGGASLSGGEGSVVGSLLGAFIMTTLRSGGSQIGWENWRQEMITGGIIIISVALDRLRARRAV